MAGYTNYKGVLLSESAQYTRQFWALGADALYGPSTPSYLMGSGAGNFIQGGSADDSIYVIATGDRVVGGGGVDTAYATVNFTLPGDVENLTMDARWSPVLGVGNDGDNILKAVTSNVTIEGKGGADVIVSAGGDTFVFAAGSGQDVLINFNTATDVVRLSGYSLSTFDQVKGAMTQVGADTLLKLSSTDLILFKNTSVSSFSANDFQLSINTGALKPTFAEEFDSLKLQQQGYAGGLNAAYSWANYGDRSAHTISGESEIYVDPTFAGSSGGALGLNPFKVEGGVLSISATQTPSWAKGALWNADYTSGLLTTAGTFSQTYGYFEMRADLPEGKGSFPAFWLVDSTYNEIDVMETVNGSDQIWGHIHYHPSEGSADRSSVGVSTTVPNLTAGFHTFGVLWTPQTLTWYVDGAAVGTTSTPATMNKPMYMLTNYAVGGSWAGAPDGSTLTDMKIDYIRAYSLDGAPVGGGSTSTTVTTGSSSSGGSGSTWVSGSTTVTTTPAPSLSVSANSTSVSEGSGGTGYAVFTVSRSGDLSGPSTANWSVSGSGANAADAADFEGGKLPSGQVFFGAGETSKAIWVPIAGDTVAEAHETFTFQLGSATGAVVGGAQATVTISNDDGAYTPPATAAPAPSVPSTPAPAPSSGSADTFTLAPASSVTIHFDPADDTLSIPTGTGGFQLRGAQPLTVTDASAWWTNISGASVIRWLGDAAALDSVAEVDGLLQSMPGAAGAGVLVAAYTSDGKVGVYYDAKPAAAGGARLVAKLDNLTDVRQLSAADFQASGTVATTTPPAPVAGAADTFTLAPGVTASLAFDPADDTLSLPSGAGGFQLRGGSALTLTDASASWANISSASVIRWVGDAAVVDSVAEVDGLLQAMPGAAGAGVMVIGYTADHKVGLYYDAAPSQSGGASLVARLGNLTDVRQVTLADFTVPAGGSTAGSTSAPSVAVQQGTSGVDYFTGTAGADQFNLTSVSADVVFNFDAAKDSLGMPLGSMVGTKGGAPVMIDVANNWTSVSGAQMVRWLGQADAVNSTAEVDGMLNALPGHAATGTLVLAYTPGLKVGVYYDADPQHIGGASLVATLDNLTDVRSLTAQDLIFI